MAQALDEIALFEAEGVNGAIVENYYGSKADVRDTLEEISNKEHKLKIGVNILPNDYWYSFSWAKKFGADFIQLDHVAGSYTVGDLDAEFYHHYREEYSDIFVMGGVWPKYYTPLKGSHLKNDIRLGMTRTDAIVVTGEGTGKETPLEKIKTFRETLGSHPLIVGAGLTRENAYEQLRLADGCIVGSSLKVDDKTHKAVDRYKVRDFMDAVNEVRRYKNS